MKTKGWWPFGANPFLFVRVCVRLFAADIVRCLLCQTGLSRPKSFSPVVIRRDVVAAKNRVSFVSRILRRDRLRHSRPNHVSSSRPAKVVERPPRNSRLFAGGRPCLPGVGKGSAFIVENVWREGSHGASSELSRLPTPPDESRRIALEGQRPWWLSAFRRPTVTWLSCDQKM